MSTVAWAACALGAAAALVVVPPHPDAVLARRLGKDAGRSGTEASLRTVWMRLVRLAQWSRAGHLLTTGVRARAQQAHRTGVVELCDVTAAELRAGRTPAQALTIAARGCPELVPVLAPVESASRFDGDVPAALRAVDRPGTEGLALIAAAWEAAEDSGAALAEILDRVGDGLRAEEELRREVRAQLSAPRATSRLLALLPAFGLLLGAGMGANPLGVLFGTPYGLGCLVLGGGLAALGLVWVERLARRAESLR